MSVVEKLIGAKITEIRLSRKLTQAQLAEMVDLAVESISRLERGVSIPSLRTLESIAEALGVPLKEFFDFGGSQGVEKSYERELGKLIAFLRSLNEQEIVLLHKILKLVYKVLKEQA